MARRGEHRFAAEFPYRLMHAPIVGCHAHHVESARLRRAFVAPHHQRQFLNIMSGLPGSRVEPYRAGITQRTPFLRVFFACAIGFGDSFVKIAGSVKLYCKMKGDDYKE